MNTCLGNRSALFPDGSVFNLTTHWANHLSLYATVEGRGAKVPFPGTESYLQISFQRCFGRHHCKILHLGLVTPPEKASTEQIFGPSRMSQRWQAIAAYFGLGGIGPIDDTNVLKPGEYIKQHWCVLKDHDIRPDQMFKVDSLDTYRCSLAFNR
jgi:hypothetical protein